MAEQSTTANERSNVVLRRILPALTAALTVWALVSSFFALDVTEYGLVIRFGRVVRVLAEPGLHVVAPFDRVVRLDKRILFFRPAFSEYLTIDKKNHGVGSRSPRRRVRPNCLWHRCGQRRHPPPPPAGTEPGACLRTHEGRAGQDRQGEPLRGRVGGEEDHRRG